MAASRIIVILILNTSAKTRPKPKSRLFGHDFQFPSFDTVGGN
ncbi:MAG TPA: hypothetical protein VH280_06335 [Verrucomicrobiae bacterium]|jgi:hypothetical protein|nr:hypothetical protein [Verrucomicrobiae bacterium]